MQRNKKKILFSSENNSQVSVRIFRYYVSKHMVHCLKEQKLCNNDNNKIFITRRLHFSSDKIKIFAFKNLTPNYQFLRTTVIKYDSLGGLKQQRFILSKFKEQKTEIKVLTGWIPSWCLRGILCSMPLSQLPMVVSDA